MIRRKLLTIASLNQLKYNQIKLITRQDLTKLNLLQLDSKILKQSTLCTCQHKLNHKLEKTGKETKGKICTQPVI